MPKLINLVVTFIYLGIIKKIYQVAVYMFFLIGFNLHVVILKIPNFFAHTSFYPLCYILRWYVFVILFIVSIASHNY